jgi:hypothetical protein
VFGRADRDAEQLLGPGFGEVLVVAQHNDDALADRQVLKPPASRRAPATKPLRRQAPERPGLDKGRARLTSPR